LSSYHGDTDQEIRDLKERDGSELPGLIASGKIPEAIPAAEESMSHEDGK